METVPHTLTKPPGRKPHHVTEGPTARQIPPHIDVVKTGEISKQNDIPVKEDTDSWGLHRAISPISFEGKSDLRHSEEVQRSGHLQPSDLHYSSTGLPVATSAPVSVLQTSSQQPPEQYQSLETPSFSFGTSASESMSSHSPDMSLPHKPKSPAQKPSSSASERPQKSTSAVPQYVRGEEHVSVYRQSYPEIDSSVAGTDAGSPSHSSISSSPASQPQLIENIKPIEVNEIPVVEERPSVVAIERPYSPPRFYWDASRYVSKHSG